MYDINYLVNIVNMREPDMTYMRIPLFTWATFITSVLILFAFPALTVNLFLLIFDRMFGSAYFNVEMGGNTIICQHLFCIFGYYALYFLFLPLFGLFCVFLSTFSRKRL